MTTHPAAFIRATIRQSSSGTKCSNNGEPIVIGSPLASARSLIACGMPCIQPRERPWAISSSQTAASTMSSSRSRRLTMALTAGLHTSM
jgi:hypothetical protein